MVKSRISGESGVWGEVVGGRLLPVEVKKKSFNVN